MIKLHHDHAYLFGAGASISTGIPLTKQFLPRLMQEPVGDRLLGLRSFIEEFFSESLALGMYPKFEQVLSLLDIAINEDHYISNKYHHKYLRQLRSDLDYLTWKMLEQSSTKNNFNVFNQFIEKTPASSLFLSLNYDTLIDHSIIRKYHNINYGVQFSKVKSSIDLSFNNLSPTLLKLHGSINWLFCPNCQTFYCYIGNEEIRKIFNQSPEVCHYDQAYLKGILISPTWQKNYNLAPISLMWIKAGKLLRDVKRITFIGYSLSDIDMKVIYLLKRSIFNNRHNPKIEVVDPDPSEKVFDRYRRIFGEITPIRSTFEQYVNDLEYSG